MKNRKTLSSKHFVLCALGALALVSPHCGAAPAPPVAATDDLKGGEELLPAAPLGAPTMNAEPADAAKIVLPATPGEPLQLIALKQAANPWLSQATWALKAPIAKGDSLLVEFEARCAQSTDASGGGSLKVVLEEKQGQKLLYESAFLNKEWKKFQFPLAASQDLAPDKSRFSLWWGGNKPATFEVRSISVRKAKTALAPAAKGDAMAPVAPTDALGGEELLPAAPLGAPMMNAVPADAAKIILPATPGDALQLIAVAQTANPWLSQATWALTAPIAKGDALMIEFEARCAQSTDESGGGSLKVVIEEKQGQKLLYESAFVNKEWKKFQFPLSAPQDLAPGKSRFSLWWGANKPATFEVRSISVRKLKSATQPAVKGDAVAPGAPLDALKGGAELLPAAPLGAPTMNAEPADAAKIIVPATAGEPLQLIALKQVANPWLSQANWAFGAPIAKGDALLVEFEARCAKSSDESGGGSLGVVIEEKGGQKLLYSTVFVDNKWKKFQFPLAATQDLAADKSKFSFWWGGNKPATFEVRSVSVRNYKTALALEALPRTISTYQGQEADAPWRAEAAARIEKYRKADLKIEVVDATGKPVPNAKVHVAMQRHAYQFGTAVNDYIWQNGVPRGRGDEPAPNIANRDAFRAIIARDFNVIVPENSLKWPTANSPRLGVTDDLIAWAAERGIATRGHNLIWAGWENMPAFMRENKDNPEFLRAKSLERVTSTVDKYRGRIGEWDVVNEMISQREMIDILGEDEVVKWYQAARATDPTVKTYLNDFGILSTLQAKRDIYFDLIKKLRAKGAPIDGVGLQGHFGPTMPGVDYVWQTVDKYAALGVDIKATEVDFSLDQNNDEALQGDSLRDFMTIFFSHPKTDGIILWGFWANSQWRGPDAALWRADFSPKPSGKVWEQLVTKDWWTDETKGSDAKGTVRTRGFKGDYEISVQANGKTGALKTAIGDAPQSVRIVLK